MSAASHSMPLDHSRFFLMLTIVVEALMETVSRPDAQLQAIDSVVQHLASLDIPAADAIVLRQALLKTASIPVGLTYRRVISQSFRTPRRLSFTVAAAPPRPR